MSTDVSWTMGNGFGSDFGHHKSCLPDRQSKFWRTMPCFWLNASLLCPHVCLAHVIFMWLLVFSTLSFYPQIPNLTTRPTTFLSNSRWLPGHRKLTFCVVSLDPENKSQISFIEKPRAEEEIFLKLLVSLTINLFLSTRRFVI